MRRCKRFILLILIVLLLLSGCSTTDWVEYHISDDYSLYQLNPQCIYLQDASGNTLISSHILAVASYGEYLFFQRQNDASVPEQNGIQYYILQADTRDIEIAFTAEGFEEICTGLGMKTGPEWTNTSELSLNWFASPKNSMSAIFLLAVLTCLILVFGLVVTIRSKTKLNAVVRITLVAVISITFLFMLMLSICLAYFII